MTLLRPPELELFITWVGSIDQRPSPRRQNREAGSDLFHPPSFIVLTAQWIPHTPPSPGVQSLALPPARGCNGELGAHWQNLPSRCFQLNALWSGETLSASVLGLLQSTVAVLLYVVRSCSWCFHFGVCVSCWNYNILHFVSKSLPRRRTNVGSTGFVVVFFCCRVREQLCLLIYAD